MSRSYRFYVPRKRAPRSLLGRRRYASTTGGVTTRRSGGVVRGVIDEVTGSSMRLGWRKRPWF